MVLDNVKQRGIEYLKSKGLHAEDVGRVIGIFFFAKYITFATMIPLCFKLKPIRRLLKPVNTARAREYFMNRRTRFQQGKVGSVIASKTKGYRDWMKQNESRILEQKKQLEEQKLKVGFKVQAARSKLELAKKRLSQYLSQKKEERRKRLRENIASQGSINEDSWSMRIFRWTEKVANRAAENEKWRTVADSFKVPPKDFAYAVGEGLVMYKLTSPIWMPLELWGIVKYLQWRRKRIDSQD
jgi:hypothetical protein